MTLHAIAIQARHHRYMLALTAILIGAFAVRVAIRAASGAESFWKNSYRFYFTLAQSLAQGHGYSFGMGAKPTAFRVPFYPIFLAGVTGGRPDFWELLIAQALVSTGTVACAAALSGHLFGRRAALVAAAITALYPYYASHDTALQETGLLTFVTALATLLLFAAKRSASLRYAAATGLVLGLAILTRSVVLPFAVFAIVWLALPRGAEPKVGKSIACAVVCAAMACAMLAPWMIRNHELTGRWTLSTEFGRALFTGNNADTFAFYPMRTIDLSAARARAHFSRSDLDALWLIYRDETATSDWFERRGLDYIAAHPVAFVANAVRKTVAAFGILPSPRHDWKTDLVAAATYGPILLLALIGVWRTRARWRELLPLYVHFCVFAGVTGVLWGHSSHRAYLDVYLIVFASGTLVAAWPKIKAAWPDSPVLHPA